MTHTHVTAPTQFIAANGIRFAYRRFEKDAGVPLLFMQHFYKDWGTGQPVVFSHGWPVNADAFEDQTFFLASHGCPCIAHDRRGHGHSSQP